jgi:hypothetical protein
MAAWTAPTAADNCSMKSFTSNYAPGATFPKGTTTVTYTAKDSADNTSICSFTVTVIDNTPPVVSCPANITTLVDSASCSKAVSFTVTATDNCPGVTVVSTPPSGSVFPKGTTTVKSVATDAAGNKDSCTFTVTVTNPAPVVTITSPASGTIYSAGTPVTFTGSFADNKGTHTATWLFDVTAKAGTVNEATGSVTATYTFSTAGVYNVKLTVKDQCSDSGSTTLVGNFSAMIVVYDPNAGFVTGGGWITSPPGAYRADTTLTGKANFGFVSKYQKGQSTPTGETEFQFQVANFNFHSTSYDWLTIAGARAQYKGSGTINGSGDYGFMLTAIDGNVNGGGGIDKFRMKVINKTTSAVIYDNQFGNPDSTTPSTALGGGSIVIHQNGGPVASIGDRSAELSDRDLPKDYALLQNYPNPFNPTTEIRFDLPENSTVRITVYNILGKEVRTLADGEWGAGLARVTWNAVDNTGRDVASGIYFVRISAQSVTSDRHYMSVRKMMLVR